MVNISKRKILDLIKNIMPQILGISGSRHRGYLPCLSSEEQCDHRHNNQQNSHFDDIPHIAVHDPYVNDIRHEKRDQHFHQHLQGHQDRCDKCLLFIFSYRL